MSAEYAFGKRLSLYLNWNNVLAEDLLVYRRAPDTPAFAQRTQRYVMPAYIMLGVRGRFWELADYEVERKFECMPAPRRAAELAWRWRRRIQRVVTRWMRMSTVEQQRRRLCGRRATPSPAQR